MKLIEKEDSREYNNLLESVLGNFPRVKGNLNISEKKALLKLVFKKIVVKEGVVTEVEFYDPFKTVLSEDELKCLIREIKPRLRQRNPVYTYARSDGRWCKWRGMILGLLRRIEYNYEV